MEIKSINLVQCIKQNETNQLISQDACNYEMSNNDVLHYEQQKLTPIFNQANKQEPFVKWVWLKDHWPALPSVQNPPNN